MFQIFGVTTGKACMVSLALERKMLQYIDGASKENFTTDYILFYIWFYN